MHNQKRFMSEMIHWIGEFSQTLQGMNNRKALLFDWGALFSRLSPLTDGHIKLLLIPRPPLAPRFT